MKEYVKCSKEMLEFIDKSPSCYHTVANVRSMLEEQGYRQLKETDRWEMKRGQGYYVTRNDSSVIAFFLPENEVEGFHIIASHSDSPSFKIKEQPEMAVENHYVKLNTEKYGGMILSTWFDRPLSVAGRVVVKEKNGVSTRLVNVDKDLLVIPSVAIHMNRDANKGMEFNPQVDMLPLFADCGAEENKCELLKLAAKSAGVKKGDILSHDLFLYARERAN